MNDLEPQDVKQLINQSYQFESSLEALLPYEDTYDLTDYQRALHELNDLDEVQSPIKFDTKSRLNKLRDLFKYHEFMYKNNDKLAVSYVAGMCANYRGVKYIDIEPNDSLYTLALKVKRELESMYFVEGCAYGLRINKEDLKLQF